MKDPNGFIIIELGLLFEAYIKHKIRKNEFRNIWRSSYTPDGFPPYTDSGLITDVSETNKFLHINYVSALPQIKIEIGNKISPHNSFTFYFCYRYNISSYFSYEENKYANEFLSGIKFSYQLDK